MSKCFRKNVLVYGHLNSFKIHDCKCLWSRTNGIAAGYLYFAGSWLIAERFPILFGKHHASISFEKLRVSAYGQDQLIAEFHNIPNSLHLSTFQGIVHLVIGSLGADPITAGDYYGIKLEHVNTNESFWLNSKVTIGEVRGKHEALYPADEWK